MKEIVVAMIAALGGLVAAFVESIRQGQKHWELSERVARLEERVSNLEKKP